MRVENLVVLAADVVIVNRDKDILLIQRDENCIAFPHTWALPGGKFDEDDLSLVSCAIREAKEETDLDVAVSFFDYRDEIGRDPRGRCITFVFLGIVVGGELTAGDDAEDARWFSISEIGEMDIAFDHNSIIESVLLSGYLDPMDDENEYTQYIKLHYPDGSVKQEWWCDIS